MPSNAPVRDHVPVPARGLQAVVCACVVLVVGMVAAIHLAVPMLAASALRPTASALVWIVDTYVIVFACLVIPGGAAGDRFGRTGVLLAGLVLFAVGALLSAVAPNVAAVLAGRVIGWSVLVIGGLVLLESLLSRRRLPVPA
jgi:MFS family permease